ncbi:MAG: hypothetical protein RSE54_04050 [Ruthenibacterium sp.]
MDDLKSVIVLKDRVYVPEHDSHDRALEELKIKDMGENAEIEFVRAQLLPAGCDVFSPIETWALIVDQDSRPDWFFKEVEKPKVIAAVKAWAKRHIFINRNDLKLTGTQSVYVKNCTILSMNDTSTVKNMCDGSTVQTMYDNSTVQYMHDTSTVKAMYDNSAVLAMCNDSTVQTMRDDSTVKTMWDTSTVRAMREDSTVKVMRGRSTVQTMCDDSTVYIMHGASTVKVMHGASTVKVMHGASTVQYMYGNSTVRSMCDKSTASLSVLHNSKPQEAVVLSESSTFMDFRTKTIYCAGGWKLAEAGRKQGD